MTDTINPAGRVASDLVHDANLALDLAGGDAALAADLMAALLDGLPDEMESLRARLAESDWPGLAEYAHQVRGATHYCGVPALDTAIESLERAAQISDGPRCAEVFTQIEIQVRRLQTRMAVASHGSSA
jgi:HPt (histidine-containing phosphotransfer) domain-containing protein